jgi:hypothetical protein
MGVHRRAHAHDAGHANVDQFGIEQCDLACDDCFGSIPHAELMLSLSRRIVDRRVLHLIKKWLECSVEETDDRGRKTRTTEAKDSGRGIPQGPSVHAASESGSGSSVVKGARRQRANAARRAVVTA